MEVELSQLQNIKMSLTYLILNFIYGNHTKLLLFLLFIDRFQITHEEICNVRNNELSFANSLFCEDHYRKLKIFSLHIFLVMK